MPEVVELDGLRLRGESELFGLVRGEVHAVPLRYVDGEFIVRENDSAEDVFIVVYGSFVVERRGVDGGERSNVVAIQSATQTDPIFVGEMAYLGESARAADVRCSGGVLALKLSTAAMDYIIEHCPDLTRRLCKDFASRLRQANETINEFQEKLRANPRQIFAKPGERIVERGSPPDTLFQLLDGTLTRDDEADPCPFRAGDARDDFLNARAFFRREPNPASFTAKSAAILLAFDTTVKGALVRNFPETALELLKGK